MNLQNCLFLGELNYTFMIAVCKEVSYLKEINKNLVGYCGLYC